jgi:hypothetical protein
LRWAISERLSAMRALRLAIWRALVALPSARSSAARSARASASWSAAETTAAVMSEELWLRAPT